MPTQLVEPELALSYPEGHRTHVLFFGPSWNRPIAQGTHDLDAGVAANVPAEHGLHRGAPEYSTAQPVGQASQDVLPEVDWKYPAAHSRHSALAVSLVTVPRLHGMHFEAS